MVLNGQCAFSFQKIYKLGFMELFRTKIPQIRRIFKMSNNIFNLWAFYFFHIGHSTLIPMEYFLFLNGFIVENYQDST